MEYQIAILRDKYDYLGEEFCNEQEKELAMLRDFPPLNYLFYPSVPEKYIVPVENPWEVSGEALDVMSKIAEEAEDRRLLKALHEYRKTGNALTVTAQPQLLREDWPFPLQGDGHFFVTSITPKMTTANNVRSSRTSVKVMVTTSHLSV